MSLQTARHSALAHSRTFYLRRMVQDNIPGICRRCYCTDRRACNPPCRWTDATHTLCSACAPSGIVIATR